MTPQLAATITDEERAYAIARLRSSEEGLLAAIADVTEEQARFKPSAERWSILEYTEHLAISDDELVGWVRKSLDKPAAPELMAEARAKDKRFTGPPREPRRGSNPAPEVLRPKARFNTLAEAAQAFRESRARTIAFAGETRDELRSHFTPHSIAGPMDGYQWLLANAIHAENHARHIEELKREPGYPA